MKYRTVIELICDAVDAEDAGNMAGDYLKGEIDFGVAMRCKTQSLAGHRLKKYTAACLIACLTFSMLLLKVTPAGDGERVHDKSRAGFQSTYTIMPVLKTKHKDDFKSVWEKKKDDAVLDCLKK